MDPSLTGGLLWLLTGRSLVQLTALPPLASCHHCWLSSIPPGWTPTRTLADNPWHLAGQVPSLIRFHAHLPPPHPPPSSLVTVPSFSPSWPPDFNKTLLKDAKSKEEVWAKISERRKTGGSGRKFLKPSNKRKLSGLSKKVLCFGPPDFSP